MKKRVPLLVALVLTVAFVAANVAVAHADDYLIVQVIALQHFNSTGFFAEVESAGQHFVIPVSEELWNRLDTGDTLVQSGDSWSLLYHGRQDRSNK